MQRCIELARLGQGYTAPNPMVGSVIVCNEKIIGEGYHRKYGEAHAEPNAINSVKDARLLKESIMYVSLEPCAHYGKTPPCAELIAQKRIPDVVIGCIDSFAAVSGKGVEILKKAGCNVKTGVLEKQCRHLNRRFFTFHEKKRPYIILKWAQTSDGFIDIIRKPDTPIQPYWITDEICRMLVHKWRAEEQAILVGTNTVEKDNPKLNTRDWPGRNPLRIFPNRVLRLSPELAIFDGSVPTLMVSGKYPLHELNPEIVQLDFSSPVFLDNLLSVLHQKGIQSLIVEGGALLLQSFIDNELWDEARVFKGNRLFYEGVPAPKIPLPFKSSEKIGNSNLYFYKNVN